MQSLALVLKSRGQTGEALPQSMNRLDRLGVKWRRGQTSLICASSGSGKSALSTHIWMNAEYDEAHAVPGIYFSADTDGTQLGIRLVAGVLGKHTSDVERLLDDPEIVARYSDYTSHIWWCFEPSPTLDEIAQEIAAYAYVHGDYPHWIVIDNIMDVSHPGTENDKLNEIMTSLNDMARKIGAHIQVLCHSNKGRDGAMYTDGNIPIPKSGVAYGLDKKARVVLTLHRPQDGVMSIRVVKNTGGPDNAQGQWGTDVAWVPERSWFGD